MAVVVSRLPQKVRSKINQRFGLEELKPSKYRNIKVKLDGFIFDSLKERDRYLQLLMMQKMGEISGLVVHPRFLLVVAGGGERSVSYEADFQYYTDNGLSMVVEDVKSRPTRTPAYRIKKKLMKKVYGIGIKEVS